MPNIFQPIISRQTVIPITISTQKPSNIVLLDFPFIRMVFRGYREHDTVEGDNIPIYYAEDKDYINDWEKIYAKYGQHILLEHDIEIVPKMLRQFLKDISTRPDEIWVAPYLTFNNGGNTYALGNITGLGNNLGIKHLQPDDKPDKIVRCDAFGFGCIYCPKEIFDKITAKMTPKERQFKRDWYFNIHCHNAGIRANISWKTQLIHYHFEEEPLFRFYNKTTPEELKEWDEWYVPPNSVGKHDLILDVGARDGDSALFYWNKGYTNMRLVEPDPQYWENLDNNVEILRGYGATIEVRKKRFMLDDLEGVAFVKLDCEGCEHEHDYKNWGIPYVVEEHVYNNTGIGDVYPYIKALGYKKGMGAPMISER